MILFIMISLFCIGASAETHVLDPIYASVDIPEEYVVLTPTNLSTYDKWLEAKRTDADTVKADFEKRGVLLQAWDTTKDLVFELRATQDEDTKLVFDVDEQSEDVRRAYRYRHSPDNEYEGFDFSSAEWKKLNGNRFLILKYTRRDGGEILYRGFMRRSIQNGYQIDLDMQVYNRATTAKDNTALNKIWESFQFIQELELPPAASAKIDFNKIPAEETNERDFAISGTASEGVRMIAVTMGLNYSEPIVCEDIVGKDGKFELPISIPKEGVFLITVTGEYQDQVVLEKAFPVTYQRTMLSVNFTTVPESVFSGKEVKFAGKAEPGATIQIFVNGENIGKKKSNGEGKFSITVDLNNEESHEVSLVFSKKGLADRRFTYTLTRKYTDADMIRNLKKQASKPSYKKLVSNIDKYQGQILGYNAYITDIAQSGDEYVIQMALAKKNSKYSDFILVTSSEEPGFAVDDKVTVYGTCEGLSDSDEDNHYPCLSLLLFVSLEK